MALFPFEPPTLQRLLRRVVDDLRTRLGTAASLLGHTAEAALAATLAGTAHPLWRALDRAARASLWATTLDTTYLEIWASIFGVYRKDPTKATGEILVTGTPTTIIPEGTRWARAADGLEYLTTAEAEVGGGGEVAIPVEAKVSGTIGNAAVGLPVFMVGTIVGVNAEATINGDAITDGIDQESLTSLSARFFDRLRNPPRGGGKGDYVRWAKELSTVTRAWEYGGEPQLGYVTVRAVRDLPDADTEVLDGPETEALRQYILSKMPLGLDCVVPEDVAIVELTPQIMLDPNTTETQAAADTALRLALSRGGIGSGSFSLSLLNQALLDEVLINRHEFVSPVGNIALGEHEVLTLGVADYQPFPPP